MIATSVQYVEKAITYSLPIAQKSASSLPGLPKIALVGKVAAIALEIFIRSNCFAARFISNGALNNQITAFDTFRSRQGIKVDGTAGELLIRAVKCIALVIILNEAKLFALGGTTHFSKYSPIVGGKISDCFNYALSLIDKYR